ncbi:response regulator transcription factor [Flavobacterium sp. DGU11]|uniref:Response regulator transcription factor n=1 Tax=Flavobacterium arundinis TaxID=3139143 RepID=A0ABU9HUC1_9FLAO
MGLRSALIKNKEVILYGACLALLLFLLRWFEFRFLILSNSLEIYIGLIAVVFMGLGIWVALKLAKPKKETIVIEKEIYIPAQKEFTFNESEAERLGLSKRELEVLQLLSEGLSNAEIAERLFVSLNTIKTHTSKIFEKLEVKRRTQAVEVGKRLGLIA